MPLKPKKPKPVDLCQSEAPESKAQPLKRAKDQLPKISKRVASAVTAFSRWVAAGRPTRSQEEVQRIITTICHPCPHFGNGGCLKCGCGVNGLGSLEKKVTWGTEGCPDSPPRWEPITKPPCPSS